MSWAVDNAVDTALADGMRDLQEATGVQVDYYHAKGGRCRTYVFVEENLDLFGPGESRSAESRLEAILLKDDIPAPQRGDRIVCGDNTLTVQDRVDAGEDGSFIRVTVK